MSTFEINKIVGAVLMALLVAMVIGKVGDGVVHPRAHTSAEIATGEPAKPQEEKKPEKVEPIAPLLAKASAEDGAKVARKCAACHDLTKAAKTKVGPPLWNVVNHDKGAHEYSYSSAMKEKPGKWSYEELNHFLHNPKGYVPGTKMGFAGLKDAKDRANVIAYLRTLSESPQPLP